MEDKLRSFLDPDYGLEVREDFIEKIEASIASTERIPFEDVKNKFL